MMMFTGIRPAGTGTKTEKKLRSFANLPAGWHYGRGGPIGHLALSTAEEVYWQLLMVGLTRTDAFPGVDGEVVIAAYQGETGKPNHYVAVEISADGVLSLTHEVDDNECCSLDQSTLREIKTALRKVSDEIWGTSVSSTQSIGTPKGVDSMTWPSRNLRAAAVFPSSSWAALPRQAA